MSLTKVSYSMIDASPINLADYGVIGDGVADDTVAIQAAIDALGALNQGRLVGPSGATYKITSTINFNLGNTTNWYELDFAGAEFVWYGSQINADPMFFFNANKCVTVKNFTLIANSVSAISATVKGIFIDSLQPDGATLLVFSGFKIRFSNLAIDLGSTTGGNQNRVSDCRFEHFLIEACTVGVQFASTNCDSLIFTNAIFSGCQFAFNFVRSGFIEINTCTGYDCDAFIRIIGPIGPLTVVNSQTEPQTLPYQLFLYRQNYTLARYSPINLIGCAIDEKIWFDNIGAGSDIQILNIIGGYFRDLIVDVPDTQVNLLGTTQQPDGTIDLAASGSKIFNQSSLIQGTLNDTANGYRLISPIDGTFVPTIIGTTTAGTATYSSQIASYTRVNDMCYVQIQIAWSGGTGTGNLAIEGLPYSGANNGLKGFGVLSVFEANVTLTASKYAVGVVSSLGTTISIQQAPTGGGTNAFVPYSANGNLTISGWYKVS